MRTPPSSFLRLQNAFRRRDHLTILAEGDDVARALSAQPDAAAWTAETALMIGVAHATFSRLTVSCSYLEHGLALAADESARSAANSSRRTLTRRADQLGSAPPAFIPEPPGSAGLAGLAGPGLDPFGPTPSASSRPSHQPFGTVELPRSGSLGSPMLPPTRGADRAGRGSALAAWAELLLLDLYLQCGRYDDALGRISSLLEPSRDVTTRFTATRAQASIAAMRADYETAHHLLNTATGLAVRVPSRFRGALVEGDRAVLLAGQGRGFEAINIADRVLASLVRPLVGDYQAWSNAEAASIALTISRMSALAGDQLTAQRMLLVGEQAAAPLGRIYYDVQVRLTRALVTGAAGRFASAERELVEVVQIANVHDFRPLAAQAQLEQARLAHRRGLVRSARPLYEHALEQFRALGQPREANQIRALLARLDV